MCGIIGCYAADASLTRARFDACRDTLQHRGPDSARTFEDRDMFLGFRRLAILDLSESGEQPMRSQDGRYVLILNGEVYNYVELRAELVSQGVKLRGHSDTEVVLELFQREGSACLGRLNGMYALALYDSLERTVLLARDRLGVKPLFYMPHGRGLAFASEVRGLKGLPGFSSDIDTEALGLFFRLGMVPEWTSLYPAVKKLPPGQWLRYHLADNRVVGPFAYWDLPPVGEHDGRSEAQWLDEIQALLWNAAHIRLRSDVPVGVFLSGGIDSGLVAAAAASSTHDLKALTIGYAAEAEDESYLASTSADHLKLQHVLRMVDLREGKALLPRLMAHFDEPFADPSALPTFIVCAEARKDVTVVLSGDGGDEVFGGYPNHVRSWRLRSVDRIPISIRRAGSIVLSPFLPRDSKARRVLQRSRQPVGRFGLGSLLYPYQDWVEGTLAPEFNIAPEDVISAYNQELPEWHGASSVDMSQRVDLRTYMLEDILTKVDRMSMLNSLEVRSPFLDYRVVELALQIPSALRVKNGQNKYLLRRLAERHLPAAVGNAPKKGFGIPLRSWLYNGQQPPLASTLSEDFNGFPNPFARDGINYLTRAARSNPAVTPAMARMLSYQWWCQGQS